MKLVTTIKPRLDGNVIVHGNDGNEYAFESNADGELVCDVECNDTIETLVNTGNFFPFDSEDYEAALRHVGGGEQVGDEDAGDDSVDEDEVPNGGMPVEASTPPASFQKPGRKPKAKAE